MRNDDGQTSLDVARINGYINVVRTIEVLKRIENSVFFFLSFLCIKRLFASQNLIFILLMFRIIFAFSLVGCGSCMVRAFSKH